MNQSVNESITDRIVAYVSVCLQRLVMTSRFQLARSIVSCRKRTHESMTHKGFHARDKIACTESHKRMVMCFQGVCVSKREGASYALEPKRVEIIKCRLIHNTPLTFLLCKMERIARRVLGFFPFFVMSGEKAMCAIQNMSCLLSPS